MYTTPPPETLSFTDDPLSSTVASDQNYMQPSSTPEQAQLRNIASEVGLDLTQATPGHTIAFAVTRESHPRQVAIKYKKINPDEIGLQAAAAQISNELRFRVAQVVSSNRHGPHGPYLVTEVIDGERADRYLGEADNYPLIARSLCEISEDYQMVINAFGKKAQLPTINHQAELAIMFTKVAKWQAEGRTLTLNEIIRILKLGKRLHDQNPEGLFGHAHGDIHAEHVFISKPTSPDGRPYLTDNNLVVRPGKDGLHDQIRSLDSLLTHGDHLVMWQHTVLTEIARLCETHSARTVHGLMAYRLVSILRDCILDAKSKKITDEQCAAKIAMGKKMMHYCLDRS
jgi:hypothetical protein